MAVAIGLGLVGCGEVPNMPSATDGLHVSLNRSESYSMLTLEDGKVAAQCPLPSYRSIPLLNSTMQIYNENNTRKIISDG